MNRLTQIIPGFRTQTNPFGVNSNKKPAKEENHARKTGDVDVSDQQDSEKNKQPDLIPGFDTFQYNLI